MLLKQKILDAIAGGRVSLVFRRWPRAVLATGDLMPSPLGPLRVAEAGIVAADDLTAEDARDAGFADVAALLASIGPGDEPIYRVHLRLADEGEGVEIGPTAVKALRRRLDRHDRADGAPWTRALLGALDATPGSAAADLASATGRPLPELRRALARLVDMGLVDAAGKGYALSPRGAAFVAAERP